MYNRQGRTITFGKHKQQSSKSRINVSPRHTKKDFARRSHFKAHYGFSTALITSPSVVTNRVASRMVEIAPFSVCSWRTRARELVCWPPTQPVAKPKCIFVQYNLCPCAPLAVGAAVFADAVRRNPRRTCSVILGKCAEEVKRRFCA